MNNKKVLIILSGLSCTLKDSVSDYLKDNEGFVKFPDVNRNYISTLKSIAEVPEMVNVTQKIPNLMLCANRLTVYNTFLDAIEEVYPEQSLFVLQRTVLEHLFFPNEDIITTVNKDKLIEAEKDFLSRFDEVHLILLQNENEEMLRKFYLTDEIRTSITKSDDKLDAYNKMRQPYARFISQLIPIKGVLTIKEDDDITSKGLTKLTKEFAESIIHSVL